MKLLNTYDDRDEAEEAAEKLTGEQRLASERTVPLLVNEAASSAQLSSAQLSLLHRRSTTFISWVRISVAEAAKSTVANRMACP
ncbi:hypothetical protein [Pseudomonas putida]|uniref:hypothetical protein n=1 Tax=Pseudomonas putida TaxID=303 RepID=UPI0023669CA3|nr:hypothetical protein [Pseudomonas putida]MDD2046217.1 hypothetical protein [Pseudomonas putida]